VEQLKDKLLSSFLVFESQLNGEKQTDLHQIRSEALRIFEAKGFPHKRLEAWKYTSLKPVLKHDYKVFGHQEHYLEFKDVKRFFLNDIDSYKLVFIDGIYSSWLSSTTHQGYDICTFASGLKRHRGIVDQYFSKAAPLDDAMVALNTAFAKEGAFIHIHPNKVVEKPIQMVFFSTGQEKEIMTQPRNLVVVGDGAEVQIIERHQCLGHQPVFTNVVTEVFAGRNAKLEYYKVQNDELHANLLDNTHIKQERDSLVNVATFSLGGLFTRNDLNFYMDGENASAYMQGITIIGKQQMVDHHTLADHRVPNCYSDELYKGVYDDRSHGVFNGKIMVHPHAQKTNAFQQNNNILLSDQAAIDTKPQLEIFADDVKCSHGCTVGQLDEEALFYMQSRGIPKKEASAMLMYAFCIDALSRVQVPELKNKLNRLIAKKLGVDLDFDL
jgi:Fe-S cluster assembly protein SufD